MNFQIPVKCSKNVKDKDNGGHSITLLLPPDTAGEDTILFAASREMTLRTYDKRTASEIREGDTLYFAVFTADQEQIKQQ